MCYTPFAVNILSIYYGTKIMAMKPKPGSEKPKPEEKPKGGKPFGKPKPGK